MVNLIGNLNMDLIMAHVKHRPNFGEEHIVNHMLVRPGGLANMIYPLFKLGIKPRVVTGLGSDEFGDAIYQEIRPMIQDGIFRTSSRTALSLGVVHQSGNRYFVTYQGHLADFTWDMLQSVKELNQAKASFFYGYFLLPNFGFEGTLASLRQAKEWGQATFFDANSDTEGWGEKQRQEIYGLLPHIDYFMPNDEEALQLTETSSVEEAAAVLLDKGAACVVITQGAGGATAFTVKEQIHHPGFPAKAFDTTGAGDSFNAGFVYARLQGYSLGKSLAFANALASIVVSRKENRYPSLQEIESQMMNMVPHNL